MLAMTAPLRAGAVTAAAATPTFDELYDATFDFVWNLLRRLGFRHEGHFVSAYLVRGVWCDDDRYAILADEWAARSR